MISSKNISLMPNWYEYVVNVVAVAKNSYKNSILILLK